MEKNFKLSELVNLEGKTTLLLGSSGSGKTTLLQTLLKCIKEPNIINIFGSDEKEWQNFDFNNKQVKFLEQPFHNDDIFNLKNEIVIFEDFICEKEHEKKFHKFITFNVRHNNLIHFIITHSVFKTNLFSKILSFQSIFLTASNANIFFAQRYDKLFGKSLTKILKTNLALITNSNNPILYITPHFIINFVQLLFVDKADITQIRMYYNDKEYFLLDVSKYEVQQEKESKSNNNEKLEELLQEFENLYPKRYNRLKIFIKNLFEFLKKKKNIDLSNYDIIIDKNKISFYDFIINSQNFAKKEVDSKTKNILLFLKHNNFKVPKFCIKNETFKNYIT